MYVFQIASMHQNWLATRQALAANNIANADTPGFKAMEVAPFETVLKSTQIEMAVTNPGHMAPVDSPSETAQAQRETPWDVNASGNDVALEKELMRAGENGRMQALDTGLMRSFQHMILSSLKV